MNDLISLDLDNDNELVFKVTVEGTAQGDASCRLMLECSDIIYAFPGKFSSRDEVTINIPILEKKIREGDYDANLEVIVNDRIFIPLSLRTRFEKSIKVSAESVVRQQKPIRAKASLVSKKNVLNEMISDTDSNKISNNQKKLENDKKAKHTRKKRRIRTDSSEEILHSILESKKIRSKKGNMHPSSRREMQVRDMIRKILSDD